MLEAEGSVQLREILDACEDGCEDAESVGPWLKVFWMKSDEDQAGSERGDGMDDAGGSDEESSPVGRAH